MTADNQFSQHDLSKPLPVALRGGVVAIGNFDGVHFGHQIVLTRAMEQSKKLGVPCIVLSFEPHPKSLFRPDSPIFRLTPESMKAKVLKMFGLDALAVLQFTKDLAATTAEDFVERYLIEAAGAAHIVTGFNFHFGKGRAGSPEFLQQMGAKRNFGVTVVEAQQDKGSIVFSSSTVRDLISKGDVDDAARMLGYRWCVSGTVIKGAQIGRTLGYPTANIELPENCLLPLGIYAVRLRRAGGSVHDGVASFGRRPTFDNGKVLLETFVFDFDADLYDEEIEVSLFSRLRGEQKFNSASALIEQMDLDSAEARRLLVAAEPLSHLDQKMCFDGMSK